MAALAGVAQSTVSYVMSGNRPISQKTRDKVEKAMRELGYVPDAHARAMISNRSHIIGLLTETTETTQGAGLFPILRAIRATAKEHGYDLILMSSTCTTEDLPTCVGWAKATSSTHSSCWTSGIMTGV